MSKTAEFLEKDHIINIDSLSSVTGDEGRETVDIDKLIASNKAALVDIVKDSTKYKMFVMTGKKLKKTLKERAQNSTKVRLMNLTIRVNGDADVGELTFSRAVACMTLTYFESQGNPEIIPSLGVGLQDWDDNVLKKMLCLAGPGAHFLTKHFYEADVGKTDRKVGYSILICMLLGLASFMRDNKNENLTLITFFETDDYLEYKTTFANMVRNMGKNRMEGLVGVQVQPVHQYLDTDPDIDSRGGMKGKVRDAFADLLKKKTQV